MLDNGLVINQPNENTRDAYKALLGEDYSELVGEGNLVSTESYRKISSLLEEFRSR